MRFLVMAIGSDGDINPMLEIAVALKEKGHSVFFFASGHYSGKVSRAGVNHVELGGEELYQKAVSDPDLWDARKGFRAVWRNVKDYLAAQYEILLEHVDEKEGTALVGSSLAFGARLLQETNNLKLTTVHLQPSVILSAQSPPQMPGFTIPGWLPLSIRKWMIKAIDETVLDSVVKEDLNNLRAKLKLDPVKNVMSTWMHSPDQVLLAFPSWYAEPANDWPENCLFAGFPITRSASGSTLSKEVIEFCDVGKPLVFTAGSAMAHSRKFFETACEATQKLGRRAIFVSNFADEIPQSLPDNIIHTLYEPFDLLFEKALVVTHHGGIGTSAQALANATPQLIYPFAHDQFDNAHRLTEASVARYAKTIETSTWAPLLDELIKSSDIKDACLKKAQLITEAKPASTVASEAIEKLNQ